MPLVSGSCRANKSRDICNFWNTLLRAPSSRTEPPLLLRSTLFVLLSLFVQPLFLFTLFNPLTLLQPSSSSLPLLLSHVSRSRRPRRVFLSFHPTSYPFSLSLYSSVETNIIAGQRARRAFTRGKPSNTSNWDPSEIAKRSFKGVASDTLRLCDLCSGYWPEDTWCNFFIFLPLFSYLLSPSPFSWFKNRSCW